MTTNDENHREKYIIILSIYYYGIYQFIYKKDSIAVLEQLYNFPFCSKMAFNDHNPNPKPNLNPNPN